MIRVNSWLKNQPYYIIEKSNKDIFKDKISIIEFIKNLIIQKRFYPDLAVIGLDALLYYSEKREEISRYIRNTLQDNANHLISGSYIIQIVIEGDLQVIEDAEKPRVIYKNKEFNLYSIFGRLKRLDLKHFYVPLNIQS